MEEGTCLFCMADLPLTYFWVRDHNLMSEKFNALIQKSLQESQPVCIRERYAYAVALFFYSEDAPFRHILYNLKYEGRTDIGHIFGNMLGRRMAESPAFNDIDAVIPVPLHWSRKWKRGYNQAEIIAMEIAAATGAGLMTGILRRSKRTETQTKLKVKDKSRNVSGAFEVIVPVQKDLHHIVLIDDLYTTGATLFACFTALRTAFPPSVRISVATLGFVGGT